MLGGAWVRRFREGKGHGSASAPLRIGGVLDGGGEGPGAPGKGAVRSWLEDGDVGRYGVKLMSGVRWSAAERGRQVHGPVKGSRADGFRWAGDLSASMG
jgi:hypothetical protein